jgi:hypothetical protein
MHSLTSALNGGEWSASRPGRFTHRERAPDTHCIGGWVGTRAVLDAVVKRKIPSLDRPTRSPALYRLEVPGSYLRPDIGYPDSRSVISSTPQTNAGTVRHATSRSFRNLTNS